MIRSNLIRKIIIGTSLFALATPICAQQKTLSEKLHQEIKGVNAQVGIAVIIDGKDTITVNNTIHYPMLSVFKFHQALAVMDYLNKNSLPIDTKLPISASDLKPDTYSPLRDKYPNGNIDLSISELLKYTLQLSDNNACDILFQYAGGTKATDQYIRSLGITDFSITATEDDMHHDEAAVYNNWTTPLAAVELLETFLNRCLFPETYQNYIYQLMVECQTGKGRLPQPLLDKGIIISHKTGSSDPNKKGQIIGTNDIGFVILPQGHHYCIAVFVKDSKEDNQTNEQIIATVSRIVYEHMQKM